MRAETRVPRDVVALSAGNLVPADGLLLEARDFTVSEASLAATEWAKPRFRARRAQRAGGGA
jgi:Mg2+-importing ATPase